MIRVNKKIEYGVLALLYLADKEDKAASVREMASNCGVPETLLSKIMQSIKNVGYVSAVYGNQGGYKLTKELSEITLLGLTEALDGPIQVAECLEEGTRTCPAKASCRIVAPMNVLNQKIVELFHATSLDTLYVTTEEASEKVAVS
ncbi:MAG: Rrf2 family transcriptional regulator [Proteobacteria bacterium]|nr:Rrf2 family transcriptional regulator [Pseudomonadota bacterium]NDC23578.1 Rrf2 family transcriptional regulator [Pseudomonadota bacterium]NDD03711.1 Rrf2 family transcriptional regulator [Pseudomonadota bacterium]NDG26850.1 Rrf2 family transcriptional regulator [Pseudomonadota bacterium]